MEIPVDLRLKVSSLKHLRIISVYNSESQTIVPNKTFTSNRLKLSYRKSIYKTDLRPTYYLWIYIQSLPKGRRKYCYRVYFRGTLEFHGGFSGRPNNVSKAESRFFR